MKDTNRSKDVKGPELKRPQEKDLKMKSQSFDGSHTGTLAKFSKDDLHEGHIEKPLTALSGQVVKGGEKGMRMPSPKGLGRSVAKKALYAEKAKDKC